MLDRRDWTSYVYVPLIVPILFLVPYLMVKSYQRSQRMSHLVESFSQGSRDLEQMNHLLETTPVPWTGVTAEEVDRFEEPDLTGFGILQDSRILDLRKWNPVTHGKSDLNSLAYSYRRLKAFKLPENTAKQLFRIQLLPTSPKTVVRFPQQQLQPKLLMSKTQSSVPGQTTCRWEASYDFLRVPPGDDVDLIVEYHSPGYHLQRGATSGAMALPIEAETAELTTWILLPERKEYRTWRLIRHPTGKPEKVEAVNVVTEYLANDLSLIAFKLLSLKPGFTYEVSWSYK